MATINQIALDLYIIWISVQKLDPQFNHFLIRDDEPLLFQDGLKGMFPNLCDGLATLIHPDTLRYIA